MNTNKIISYAIDFGTSNTLITAVSKSGVSQPLPIETSGHAIIKSLLFFNSDVEVSFGEEAIQQYTENDFEGRFIRSIKKFLPDEKFLGTNINNRNFSIESLIGSFLREIKTRADKHIGQNVETVVMGRPAKFSMDNQKDKLAEDRLYRAAKIAGFKEISFLAEPLAAAYDFPENTKAEKIFVIDLGAGTSDFSAVKLLQNKTSYDVLAINAVSVAGDAYDGALMDHSIAPHFGTNVHYRLPLTENTLKMPEDIKYRLRSPADISFLTRSDIKYFLDDIAKSHIQSGDKKQIEALQILLEDNLAYDIYSKIEKSKIEVCENNQSLFSYIYPGINISEDISLSSMENSTIDVNQKIITAMNECLDQASMSPKDFDLIVLTGGSCRIPFLSKYFASTFSKEKLYYSSSFTSVVTGLGIEAKKRYS
ncbi:MAG: Hsp70 family protein [Bdellovibrionales bacterium]|nr:Hsp70 family protein [Bdellovibrionales bacterium]